MRVADHDLDTDFADILTSARTYAKTLWEKDFVDYLSDKYDEYGDDMFLSERQAEIILRIARVEA